jgi:hypothetical protein
MTGWYRLCWRPMRDGCSASIPLLSRATRPVLACAVSGIERPNSPRLRRMVPSPDHCLIGQRFMTRNMFRSAVDAGARARTICDFSLRQARLSIVCGPRSEGFHPRFGSGERLLSARFRVRRVPQPSPDSTNDPSPAGRSSFLSVDTMAASKWRRPSDARLGDGESDATKQPRGTAALSAPCQPGDVRQRASRGPDR